MLIDKGWIRFLNILSVPRERIEYEVKETNPKGKR